MRPRQPPTPAPVTAGPFERISIASWLLAIAVTIASAWYVGRTVDDGWVPHDEGALAQSAERVMHGALPHRDFGELYTGGLSTLNALAFRTWGVRLTVLRTVMLVAFILTVPAIFYIAHKFVGVAAAAAATALAVVWSVPNYPAALPSWYNLFLAIAATALYFQFLASGQRRWLVATGVAVGASIAVKIVGIYLAAAIVVGLIYREQRSSSISAIGDVTTSDVSIARSDRWYSIALTGILASIAVGMCVLVRSGKPRASLVHFILPTVALLAVVIAAEWTSERESSSLRARRLARLMVPFVAGLALPIAILIAPYVAAHALRPLLVDLFVRAPERLRFATHDFPSIRTGWPALVVGGLLLAAARMGPRAKWCLASVIAAVSIVAGSLPRLRSPSYTFVWGAARIAIPLTVLYGCGTLILGVRRSGRTPLHAERLFVMLAVTTFCSLVQFPFAAPIYWCYVAPLAVLALTGVFASQGNGVGPVGVAVVASLFVFAVGRVNGQSLAALGVYDAPRAVVVPLGLPRTGLRVPADDRDTYRGLVALVRNHVGSSGYAYAGPDAPEVTFLAGLRDPTRTLFDFLDDSSTHVRSTLDLLSRYDVRVVALHDDPEFSYVDPVLIATLRRRYPRSDSVGSFEVRWR